MCCIESKRIRVEKENNDRELNDIIKQMNALDKEVDKNINKRGFLHDENTSFCESLAFAESFECCNKVDDELHGKRDPNHLENEVSFLYEKLTPKYTFINFFQGMKCIDIDTICSRY